MSDTAETPTAHTDADVLAAEVALAERGSDEGVAEAILDATAPAIAARALRDAARDLERRSGLFKLRPSDKVRRQTHADIAGHLRARADEIEAGR